MFKNSKIVKIARYTEAGHEIHHRPAGSVLTVEFELNGQPFMTALLQMKKLDIAALTQAHASS